MRLYGLLALVTAAEPVVNVPGWAYALGTLVVGGGGVRWYLAKVERRLKGAETNRTDAQAHLADAQAIEIEERLRTILMKDVDQAMQKAREETARAQAAEAEAVKELAIIVAEHSRDRASWKEERHQLVNDLRAANDKITVLQAEVRSLRIRVGVAEGRRVDDQTS